MNRTRAKKMAEIVKEEVSEIIAGKLKDPHLGFVTITSVDVTNDLRYCKLYVSVLGSETERTNSFKALEKATGFIRSELGARIRVRHVPEIKFVLDQSASHQEKINELLQKLHSGAENDRSD
ncbi:MAG: 30S ribosome-binding factor RbfA [Firmicutes bacterium]|nr:30S ribosome-binding factor RbfA [Bacillota bacterium]